MRVVKQSFRGNAAYIEASATQSGIFLNADGLEKYKNN